MTIDETILALSAASLAGLVWLWALLFTGGRREFFCGRQSGKR